MSLEIHVTSTWIPNAFIRRSTYAMNTKCRVPLGDPDFTSGVANTSLRFLSKPTQTCLLFISRWWEVAIVTLAEIHKWHPNHQIQRWSNEAVGAHHPGRSQQEDAHLVCKTDSKHFMKGDNFLWPMNILFISDSGAFFSPSFTTSPLAPIFTGRCSTCSMMKPLMINNL